MELFSFLIRFTSKLVIGIGAKSIKEFKIRYQQITSVSWKFVVNSLVYYYCVYYNFSSTDVKSLKGIYHLRKQRSSKFRLRNPTTVRWNFNLFHIFQSIPYSLEISASWSKPERVFGLIVPSIANGNFQILGILGEF